AGAQFNTYSYSAVALSSITGINEVYLPDPTYSKIISLSKEEGYNKIRTNNKTYLITKEGLENQEKTSSDYLILYENAPAINAELNGAIISVNNIKINGWDELGEQILKYSPGDKITLTTIVNKEIKDYEIILGENPDNLDEPYLGIGYAEQKRTGILGKLVQNLSSFKKQHVYYEPEFGAAEFIYDFLWWIAMISLSVALVNMLPMGIFDGGRFFYLTILSLTKSEKKAERWFKISTNFLLLLLLILMVFWVISWIV
ncbi:MAG TPA: M50 family metallopeptidase, partial [Candidatus Pacearchaeota archaeon]|nr:M50 family metallopeptidase [Candidatus Pacearchaeota archaeon]